MLAFLSSSAPENLIDELRARAFSTVALPPFSALQAPVASHADMLLLSYKDTLFVHKDYLPAIASSLDGVFQRIVPVDEPISSAYPNDVLLNIAIVGKSVFANTKHASHTVLDYLVSQGLSVHHVNQGYAHCSTCIVSDNAIITADAGIANAAKSVGIDTLLISSGNITLPGYDHGFIGGATGADDSTVYFCGSLSHHPDGEAIKAFCKSHGKVVVELVDAPLADIGGILFGR